MKTAFILHGYNGDTTSTFGPSLKNFLEKKGYNVIMPNFPIRLEASFDNWSEVLDNYKDLFNESTIVVAHSIGNPFFIKYLSNNKLNAYIYISVAGFGDLFKIDNREDLNNAFIDFSINDEYIKYLKENVKNRFSLYGDKDHIIPFNILENFPKKIESTPVFIKGIGHMGNRDKVSRLPQIEDIINKLV